STFWEYVKAEQYYFNYRQNSEEQWLDKMIATLYRPARKNYDKYQDEDIRVPLNETATRFHLKEVAKLDIETKLSILMWFDSCRLQLTKHFPKIFPAPVAITDTEVKPVPQKALNPQVQWLQLISETAGTMENYRKVADTNLIIAFTDITHRITKNEKARQEAAKRARTKR
ncbi:hypothetical protein, partial [Belliella pelovolcani]|uniref:hypothetical protein n=1 Tax=Belliella pelovolcani TaxID=529505 RepID=UPI00391B3B86